MNVLIDRSEIRTLIPHSGTMCLLDGVFCWDDDSIVCITNTHRDANNPLRRDGQSGVPERLAQCARPVVVGRVFALGQGTQRLAEDLHGGGVLRLTSSPP